ncbi:MAG TPA: sulfonate ABC transporter substrate-binding protein [Xanthobacteraceae bacterium]|nr:sulfonate ABC transporter substrate-binding protein [Xanthobacteraceae bacterium]
MRKSRHIVFAAALAAALAIFLQTFQLPASAADHVIRIGYQKYGNFILLKGTGELEKKLAPKGYTVEWTEFPSGPPLLEAINAGAIDFGQAGEAPPIFAQAAAADFVYIAHEPPAPKGEAILVPKDSPITSLAELKGKKIALNKGSNVHYLLVKLLDKVGIKYSDITPVFLAPADARAAFERGSVDAWVIWDPFQASAEVTIGARTLADGTGVVPNNQFYLARKAFAEANPQIVDAVIDAVAATDRWAEGNSAAVAQQLSAGIGISVPVLEIALKRQTYGIKPLDDATVAQQQSIADTFYALGLLPKPVQVSAIVWKAGS